FAVNKAIAPIHRDFKVFKLLDQEAFLVIGNFIPAEFAKLCGGDGVTVREPGDLDAAFEKCMISEKPFIVEIMTDAMLT
ncbi:hypothetical protein, partial [Pseudobacteriovorax antillogorgiicola]